MFSVPIVNREETKVMGLSYVRPSVCQSQSGIMSKQQATIMGLHWTIAP